MKILTNKKINEMNNYQKALENDINKQDLEYQKIIQDYDFKLEEIYIDLLEFKNLLKQTSSKKTMKEHIDKIIKKLGGK